MQTQAQTTQSQEPQTIEDPATTLDLDADSTVEGVEELAAELDSTAEGFSVSGFKCSNCGLAHGHDTDKHRASDSFALGHEDAGGMDANPNCHCGAHELAARGGDYGVDESSARSTASNAPVPDSVHKQFS